MENSVNCSARQILAAAVIAVAALWGASALVLYLILKPLVSLDNGRSLVFDPIALVDATSIVVAVAFVSWVPIFLFARRIPTVRSTVLASVSTLVLLGALFFLVDNVLGPSRLENGFFARASLIFANGNDIEFLPVVDPFLSVLSGIAYSGALWISNILARRNSMGGVLSPVD